MKYALAMTKRGTTVLVYQKRIYYRNHRSVGGRTVWICSNKRCRVKLRTEGDEIIEYLPHVCTEKNLSSHFDEDQLKLLNLDYCDSSNTGSTFVNDETGLPKCYDSSDATAIDLHSGMPISESSNFLKKEKNSCKRLLEEIAPAPDMSQTKKEKHGKQVTLPMTTAERNHYFDLIEENVTVLFGPFKDRTSAWELIATQYNERASTPRTLLQLRKYWTNVKMNLKKKLARDVNNVNKLSPRELRPLCIIPVNFFSDVCNMFELHDCIQVAKATKDISGSILEGIVDDNLHKDTIYEIVLEDSNSFLDDGLDGIEEENPLAVSTADCSSMDEQISFSKDSLQIQHVQDTPKYTSFSQEKPTKTHSPYKEEHFYDLDEEPTLDDTPNVHVSDILSTEVEYMSHSSHVAEIELSQAATAMQADVNVDIQIPNAEQGNSSENDSNDSAHDPTLIDNRPRSKNDLSSRSASQANGFFASRELQNLLKIQAMNSAASINSIESRNNSRVSAAQTDSKKGKIIPRINILSKSPNTRPIKPKITVSANIFERNPSPQPYPTKPSSPKDSIIAGTPSFSDDPILINPVPPVCETMAVANVFATPYPVNGICDPPYPISTTQRPSYSANSVFRQPFPVHSDSPPYPISAQPATATAGRFGVSEEYLHFSKEYIYKRMNMENTKFQFKMENLRKERECLAERHELEMKVLQFKLKYISAQYEEMKRRNQTPENGNS